jgi:hypothetical protein
VWTNRICIGAAVLSALMPCGGAAIAQGIRVIAVGWATGTVPQQAVELLTKITSAAPLEPTPFALTWANAPEEPSQTCLRLEMIPSASFQGGKAQWVLLSVRGTLTMKTGQGAASWAVSQGNFGSMLAHAEYKPDTAKLTLLLPVLFTPQAPTTGEPVHALLLIPCKLQDDQLSCGTPRLAFEEMVRRHFPKEAKPADVLPTRLEPVEETKPVSINGVGEPTGIPPSQMACCLDDAGIIGQCWTR